MNRGQRSRVAFAAHLAIGNRATIGINRTARRAVVVIGPPPQGPESGGRGVRTPRRMERLSSVAQQLGCRAEPAATAVEESATAGALRLLTREQLATFVVDGVLVLQVDDLPPSFHAELYQRCQDSVGGKSADEARTQLFAGRFPWPDMPEIEQVCGSATVRGALTSILGRDFAQHPHRHLHHPPGRLNTEQADDQTFRECPPPLFPHPTHPRRPCPHCRAQTRTGTTCRAGSTSFAMSCACTTPPRPPSRWGQPASSRCPPFPPPPPPPPPVKSTLTTTLPQGSQYYECNKLDWRSLWAGEEPPLDDPEAHAAWLARAEGQMEAVHGGVRVIASMSCARLPHDLSQKRHHCRTRRSATLCWTRAASSLGGRSGRSRSQRARSR